MNTNTKYNILIGKVLSNKMKKSIIVEIEKIKKHNLYKKFIKRKIKINAHDENNISKIGNLVKIQECKPISKTKFWKLIKIIKNN